MMIRTKKLDPAAQLPFRATNGAAGYDLFSVEDVEIPPGECRVVGTGLSVELPPGYEMQIRSRSGLAAKNNVFVLNSPGTIDSDYRGEVKVILFNLGAIPFYCKHGARIAQAVVSLVPGVSYVEVPELDETQRSDKGFGHSGV